MVLPTCLKEIIQQLELLSASPLKLLISIFHETQHLMLMCLKKDDCFQKLPKEENLNEAFKYAWIGMCLGEH